MVVDPVCGMSIAPEAAARTSEQAGRTYYFCSPSCHTKFLADPDAYTRQTAPPAETPDKASAAHTTPHPGARTRSMVRAVAIGTLATAALLALYFGLVSVVSGIEFTRDQFAQFWPFVIALAVGFGVQVGMYTFLRNAVHGAHASGKVVAVSGTTSGAAMVSCCTHYLVNRLPARGATGLVTLVGQYQVELFWFGLAANAAGILYVGSRLVQFTREA